MNNFEYINPVHVVFGDNAIDFIGEKAGEIGKKALIVSYTDVSFFEDLFEKIKNKLKDATIEVIEYFNITANPTIGQCEEGIQLVKKENCDLIIAVGGGSVMDAGKIIAAGTLYKGDIRKMVSFSHSDTTEQVLPEEALPMILIPTLPATGSEMNPTAVVTDEVVKKKSYLYAPNCLYAKYALVDPSLSISLPTYQTACAAFDTMAHVMEGYFNGEENVELILQDNMQMAVIKAVYDTLPKVIHEPSNIQYRGVMQWASAIALNGWVLSGTYGWAPMHQMAHVISARYNATHGATLSTIMLGWLRYYDQRENNVRFTKFANELFGVTPNKAADILEKEMKKYKVETNLRDYGIEAEEIEAMVEDVVKVSFGSDNLLNSVPKLNRQAIVDIYKLCY